MRAKACGTWQDYAHTGIPEWMGLAPVHQLQMGDRRIAMCAGR